MWKATGNNMQMTVGDFGIELPVTISGISFNASDSVRFDIKNGDTSVLQKTFTNVSDNTVTLELTEEESALFKVGVYLYSLDWYRDGVFMCNLVEYGIFRVVDKA